MYTIEEFIQRVEASNGLVCYGVGKRLKSFEQCFMGTSVTDKIKFCIDLKSEKKKILIDNRQLKIYGAEKLSEIKNKGMVLLVTNLRYEEIISELEKYGLKQGVHYFCFTHLYGMILEEEAMKKSIPVNCRIEKKEIIPKVIHYCWFGRKPLPDNYRRWMESWHRFCPDYEIKEWNEDNYDIKKNRYMFQAYQNEKWGFVVDYARLDIIYEFGGIYFDTDVELVANLDDMLYQKAFAGFERQTNVALGLGFGATPHLQMIKEMRDMYDDLSFVQENGELNLVASPVYQTDFLVKRGLVLNGEYQKVGDMVIYPEKMFSGKCPYTRRVRLTSYTKSIHHYDASWADDEWKNRNARFEKEMNEI